jgi:hypothetical protein
MLTTGQASWAVMYETPFYELTERPRRVKGYMADTAAQLVLQLLRRGQTPESIRIVDFVPLNRSDMLNVAAGCDYVKADIASRSSVEEAFSKPWPKSVAEKPLTVFHSMYCTDNIVIVPWTDIGI